MFYYIHTKHLLPSKHINPVSYHSDKQAKLWIQIHSVSISKNKCALLVLACCQNYVDLLSSNREHWQVDSVELIKTTPGP